MENILKMRSQCDWKANYRVKDSFFLSLRFKLKAHVFYFGVKNVVHLRIHCHSEIWIYKVFSKLHSKGCFFFNPWFECKSEQDWIDISIYLIWEYSYNFFRFLNQEYKMFGFVEYLCLFFGTNLDISYTRIILYDILRS